MGYFCASGDRLGAEDLLLFVEPVMGDDDLTILQPAPGQSDGFIDQTAGVSAKIKNKALSFGFTEFAHSGLNIV